MGPTHETDAATGSSAGASSPLISFGIPAYNRPHLLAETLASIAAQTATVDYEVVVCDDGGQPQTQAVVARFDPARFHYHRNTPPLGAVGNWNECLRRARGRWVMVLHEDDTLYPWYLASTLPRLREGVAAVATKVVSGATTPPRDAPRDPAGASVQCYRSLFFLKSSMTPFPGVLISREHALRIGGFDQKKGPLADYDFWYRLATTGTIEVVRTVGAFYRVADDQWTARTWTVMLPQTHLLRLRIARDQLRSQRIGRWFARFFTYRNALAYARRFPQRPAALSRTLRFKRIPLSFLPSGWVWAALRLRARWGPACAVRTAL